MRILEAHRYLEISYAKRPGDAAYNCAVDRFNSLKARYAALDEQTKKQQAFARKKEPEYAAACDDEDTAPSLRYSFLSSRDDPAAALADLEHFYMYNKVILVNLVNIKAKKAKPHPEHEKLHDLIDQLDDLHHDMADVAETLDRARAHEPKRARN